MGFYAYKLDDATREGLLSDIPPQYPATFADHIGYKTGKEGESMPELDKAEIIGVADNGKGLQAAIVRINGSVERPDGKIYNIAWSASNTGSNTTLADADALAQEVMGSDGIAKANAKARLALFEKPIRIGADAVHIDQENLVTAVKLHGLKPAAMQPGSISHVISPTQSVERTV